MLRKCICKKMLSQNAPKMLGKCKKNAPEMPEAFPEHVFFAFSEHFFCILRKHFFASAFSEHFAEAFFCKCIFGAFRESIFFASAFSEHFAKAFFLHFPSKLFRSARATVCVWRWDHNPACKVTSVLELVVFCQDCSGCTAVQCLYSFVLQECYCMIWYKCMEYGN